MPTGYKVAGGADLDSVFLAGSGGAATGYKVAGGADLSSVFAPYASGSLAATTGYKLAGGADMNTRFQNINVPLQTVYYSGTLTIGYDSFTGSYGYVSVVFPIGSKNPTSDPFNLDFLTNANEGSGYHNSINFVYGLVPDPGLGGYIKVTLGGATANMLRISATQYDTFVYGSDLLNISGRVGQTLSLTVTSL